MSDAPVDWDDLDDDTKHYIGMLQDRVEWLEEELKKSEETVLELKQGGGRLESTERADSQRGRNSLARMVIYGSDEDWEKAFGMLEDRVSRSKLEDIKEVIADLREKHDQSSSFDEISEEFERRLEAKKVDNLSIDASDLGLGPDEVDEMKDKLEETKDKLEKWESFVDSLEEMKEDFRREYDFDIDGK